MIGFVASSIMLPHLQIEPLEFHRVLFGVEQRARYSLLPHLATDLLQAGQLKERESGKFTNGAEALNAPPELLGHPCGKIHEPTSVFSPDGILYPDAKKGKDRA